MEAQSILKVEGAAEEVKVGRAAEDVDVGESVALEIVLVWVLVRGCCVERTLRPCLRLRRRT